MMRRTELLIIVSLIWILQAVGEPLAPSPPMGWNSWNWHGKKDINEKVVFETIDAMVATGLRDAGYSYIVVDGGWRAPTLGPDGELRADPEKFPSGMKALADYAHANGFKFGLHTVPGQFDCGGSPVGGYGVEAIHVAQFVEWGLDFVKLDRCIFAKGESWDEETIEAVYRHWSQLLKDSGRDILLSISAYEFRDWYPEVASMARTTYDIDARVTGGAVFDRLEPPPNFLSVMRVADLNNRVASKAGNGYWNDPDMMVTGEQGLSEAEQQAHFALWCMMSSPLILGNDPRHMTDFERRLLTNPGLIAINQDATEQGRRIVKAGSGEVWLKRLAGGQFALLFLNRGNEGSLRMELDLIAIGAEGDALVSEVFGPSEEVVNGSLEVELDPRSCRVFRLSQ